MWRRFHPGLSLARVDCDNRAMHRSTPVLRRPRFAVLAALTIGMVGVTATAASRDGRPLSAADAAAARRFAVVSRLGDGISGTYRGLSAFDHHYLFAPAVWQLDRELEQLLVDRIDSSGRFDDVSARPLEVVDAEDILSGNRRRPIDIAALVGLARRQGFDTLLAVIPQQPADQGDVAAGVSFELRRIPGGTRTRTCAAVVLRVFRLSDGAPIGEIAPAPCSRRAEKLPWHADWRDYPDSEADSLLVALRRQSRLVVTEGLAAIGLRSGFRPGHRSAH